MPKPKKPIKYVVGVGKSEVHLYPVEHTREEDYCKRRLINVKPVLKDIGPEFDALAMEGTTEESFRREIREAFTTKKKFKRPTDRRIREKVVSDNLKLLIIDAVKVEQGIDEDKDKIVFFSSLFVPLEEQERNKLLNRFKIGLTEHEFRNVIMTSNLIKGIKLLEKEKGEGVKVALIAHPSHVNAIKEYLESPEEFKRLKRWVMGIARKYGTSKWSGVAIQKPENTRASTIAKLKRAVKKVRKK